MSTYETRLPSGAVINIRPWKIRDVSELETVGRKNRSGAVQRLMASCTDSVVSAGPYELVEDRLDWQDVLLGDQMVAKIAMFAASHPGEPYEPKVRCPECGVSNDVQVDVDELLRDGVIDYPPETVEAIREGRNEFLITVGGHELVMRVMDGRLQTWAEKHVRSGGERERLARQIGARIVSVDGVERRSHIVDFVGDLNSGQLSDLLREFDAVDGGVETTAEVSCKDCRAEFEFELPFEGAEFWMPSQSRIRRSRASRTRGARRTKTTG